MGGHVNTNVRILIFLIEDQVPKLLRIITRFFVSYIKISVMLKISVLKKLYFAAKFQPMTIVTKNSIL